ncbi:hypothetical protein TWF506_004031 [Arthrobotrys conoides]|uniref:Uncharacterized protein n=1 Tax=Arthrobotrys conoides TaxID=74498 RepID=A0AAN8RIK6_9PEZI
MGVITRWVPVTDEDKNLAEAVSKLAGSAEDGFTTYKKPTGGVANKFILHSQGISDLQRYVLMGMQFPSDNAKFEAKMPKSYFASITKVDATIWERTREQFVQISVSCKGFNDKYLHRILSAAATTRNYAIRALHDLSVAKFVNLRENLLVLLDEKYKHAPHDEDYNDSRDAAVRTLKKLESDATSSKADLAKLLNGLRSFEEETGVLRKSVLTLSASYDRKYELEDGSSQTINEIADSEHTRVLKSLEAAGENLRSENTNKVTVDMLVHVTTTTTCFAPLYGLGIVGHIYSETKLAGDVRVAEERVHTLDAKEAAVAKLITYIAALKLQFKSIEKTMEKAIKAMQDLDHMFDKQQACFESLIKAMDSINKDLDITSYRVRCGGVIDCVDTAIMNLEILQQSADEFYKFHSEQAVVYERFSIWD